MKKFGATFLLAVGVMAVVGSAQQAKAWGNYIPTGLYNIGRMTYYIDGRGAYCQNYAYDNRWRQLSPNEAAQLNYMTFTGVCGHP